MTSKQAEDIKAKAARAIQDSEYVSPGSVIQLDFYQAIDLYKKAHAAGRREALSEKDTPFEYTRGYEQGVKVGRKEAEEGIAIRETLAYKNGCDSGRREVEEKLNAHERSFLRVSIERDEAYERGRKDTLEALERTKFDETRHHAYTTGFIHGKEQGRKDAIAEVMPTIEFYISQGDAMACGATIEDGGKQARVLKEKLK